MQRRTTKSSIRKLVLGLGMAAWLGGGGLLAAPAGAGQDGIRGWQRTGLSTAELMTWSQWGRGSFVNFRDQSLHMVEDKDSEGLMLISPEPMPVDSAVSYRVMTLQPATVLVVMHSFAENASGALKLPANYDGGVSALAGRSFYFFAFHNAPHKRHPFVRRSDGSSGEILVEAKRRHLQPGLWHEVEVGRSGQRVWLKVDGEVVLDARDSATLPGGHLAFRIRGTGIEPASCLITDVVLHRLAR